MLYTLRQLQVFLATAHFQNITKAADSLSMSQSAASGSLKEFERQFDLQLFDRVGKRLQLNSLGQQIRPQVESLLAQAESLQQQLLQPHTTFGGELSLGATLTIGNYLAVPLIADYQRQYPGADVQLTIANTAEVVRRVLQFEIDIGLIEGELSDNRLTIQRWREDELVLFCSATHPLAQQKVLSEDQLSSVKWILREQGSGTRQAFERVMQGLLTGLQIAFELEQTEAIKQAVLADLGIACLPRIALQREFENGQFVPLSLPGRQFKRYFYLIMHKEKYQTANIQQWLMLCG